MRFIADLHVHSRYSRATSPEADLRGFHRWAQVKGISLVGTGDFTHPAWRSSIKEERVEEDGLLRFREPPRGSPLSDAVPADIPVRFILSAEISSIYKKKGATRKVHSLLFAPTLQAAEKLSRKLGSLGNVESDGRPILGLDPKVLLELLLEAAPEGMLIPAHIWTPWFSVFGSKSGFDAIEDCFEELTPHIHALETGLSSDPPMNWRWSALDRFRLVSNSDAHSPANLGREANLMDTELSWSGVAEALRSGKGFLGTFEFHPEEGKYHADGHRKCGVRMEPEETMRRAGLCPECGKPVTVGVLNRGHALADRPAPVQPRPDEGFRYLVPLPELLSEVAGTGPASKPVQALYQKCIASFGSEYAVLFDAPLPEIERVMGRLVSESITRLRQGRVSASAGYDGEFGRITVFEPGELETLRGQDELFTSIAAPRKPRRVPAPQAPLSPPPAPAPASEPDQGSPALDPDQEAAVSSPCRAVVIFAGPGSGKTRVLVHWIARRLQEAPEAECALAVTFTNRAAAEMRERLRALGAEQALAATFHSFCVSVLKEADPSLTTLSGESGREQILSILMPGHPRRRIHEISRRMERVLEGIEQPDEGLSSVIDGYERRLAAMGAADISSLVGRTERMLRESPVMLDGLRARFPIIAVDELQDINAGQYRLLHLLAGDGAGALPRILCIGDPDQAIYSFRGSDSGLFLKLGEELSAAAFRLTRNYRSAAGIVRAAGAVLATQALVPVRPDGPRIRIYRAQDPVDEGRHIAECIHGMVGGVDAISADAAGGDNPGYSFADIAVLFRTRAVRDALLPALRARSIPVTLREGSPVHAREPGRSIVAALRLLVNPADLASLASLLAHVEAGASPAAAQPAAREGFSPAALIAARILDSGAAPQDLPVLLEEQRAITADTRARLAAVLAGRDELLSLSSTTGIISVMDRVTARTVRVDRENPDAVLDLELLQETAAEAGADLPGFLHRLELLTVESEGAVKSERVRLLTFHAAKGLEFPVVFIAGAEEGITPMSGGAAQGAGAPPDPDEERRLFYVAITRARDRLHVSRSARREVHGQWTDREPSRFLCALPPGCVEEDRVRAHAKRPEDRQLHLFG